MTNSHKPRNCRILVIDDHQAIHEDFRKILAATESRDHQIAGVEAILFGASGKAIERIRFDVDSAYQGQQGFDLVQQALEQGRPYAVAFIDVRMPPGWDGIETIGRIWQICPHLQVVLCTAYADYSWEEMINTIGVSDRLVILKKPFENIEVLQLAHALTEKWQLALEARYRMEDLENMVTERTRDLKASHEKLLQEMEQRQQMEEQLRQSQKLESVGQLAAGVAHHFNNILQIIQGHTGLLLAGEFPDPTHHASLQEISAAVTRAANLARQLLTFSRRQLLRPKVLNLNEVINHHVTQLQRILGEPIHLRLDLADPLPNILADPGMMQQVVVILVANSRDAMPEGGQLSLNTTVVNIDGAHLQQCPEAREGRFVCLSVADRGCGMTERTRERLFEPFFTTKDVGQGTGLGLATTYGIVKQHHGWIEVQTAVGQGTTFKVFLPVHRPGVTSTAYASTAAAIK